MVLKRTYLKPDNQTQLNPKHDDTSVDKPIKKVITLKNLLTHISVNLDSYANPNITKLKSREEQRTNRTVIKNPYDNNVKNNLKTTS